MYREVFHCFWFGSLASHLRVICDPSATYLRLLLGDGSQISRKWVADDLDKMLWGYYERTNRDLSLHFFIVDHGKREITVKVSMSNCDGGKVGFRSYSYVRTSLDLSLHFHFIFRGNEKPPVDPDPLEVLIY